MEMNILLQAGSWLCVFSGAYLLLAIFGAARIGHTLVSVSSPRKIIAAAFLGKDLSTPAELQAMVGIAKSGG